MKYIEKPGAITPGTFECCAIRASLATNYPVSERRAVINLIRCFPNADKFQSKITEKNDRQSSKMRTALPPTKLEMFSHAAFTNHHQCEARATVRCCCCCCSTSTRGSSPPLVESEHRVSLPGKPSPGKTSKQSSKLHKVHLRSSVHSFENPSRTEASTEDLFRETLLEKAPRDETPHQMTH